MSTEPTPVDDPLGLEGTMVGPYAVLSCTSVGGFAAVYRAEHESLHFTVALKVLMPEVVPEHARATLEECFLREAQILGQLRSEHVLRAHHHGKVPCPIDGLARSYIVVDWLEGQELSRAIEARLERGEPYSIEEVIEFLEPIALALDAVHAQGLVHRDVNSRNIFLVTAPDGGLPRAMLIDFGFAKQAEQSVSGLVIQESTDTLMAGSPDFASPEHFDRQRFGEPSPRTDLYTFALTMVHALTLKPPLSGDSPRELYEATLDTEKRPTPNRRGAKLRPEVDALFARALAVDPKDRPGGLLQWWKELKETVARGAGQPEPPAPVSVEPEPQSEAAPEAKPARRRKIGAIVLFSVLALAAVGVLAAAAFGVKWQTKPECGKGFADCNKLAEDGCETNLAADPLHCGACGVVCSSVSIDGECRAGQCAVRACRDKRRRDCNHDFADGCETDVTADPRHCGGCESRCSDEGTRKVACKAGACLLTCRPDRANCDGKAENGCETQIESDAKNCGACGVSCKGRGCKGGLCEPERVAALAEVGSVGASGGEQVVWSKKSGKLEVLSAGSEPQVLWTTHASLTALALSKDLVVWAQDKPAMIYALAREPKAQPKRLAGPMPKGSALEVSADRDFITFVSGAKKITTAPFDKALFDGKWRVAECSGTPRAYGGNAERQLCCSKGKPLTATVCGDGGCEQKPYGVLCPTGISVDGQHAYYIQGVRVIVRLNLESGKVERWLTRSHLVTDVIAQGEWLYWTEAGRDLWRASLTAKEPTPQRLAHGPKSVRFFIGDAGAYWLEPEKTDAGEAFGLMKSALP